MKNNKIMPLGLKGEEINERMRHLMGIKTINENKTSYVIELTKIGPDNKAYAIVRENHEYYIKISDKTSNILAEDFKYIGGLQNKKSESYPSYAKATKHLNLRFNSLAEAFDKELTINVLKDDNLLSEYGFAGFSQVGGTGGNGGNGGNGFSGAGNLAGNTGLYGEEEEVEEEIAMTEEEAIIEAMLTEKDCGTGDVKEESMEESIDRLTDMLEVPSENSENSEKIESIIAELTKNKQEINPNNISIASLFSDGGTVSEEEAAAYLKKKV